MSEPTFSDTIRTHYETYIDNEDARLRGGTGRLELARVQEIVRRNLPQRPLRVLDVGGATGVHAEWLLADGHTVHLVDPVAVQVERAAARLGGTASFTSEVGDVRALPVADASFDVILMFGPLYHLPEPEDRATAWREAARAVVPGGLVMAQAITRFGSLFDGLSSGYLFEPEFRRMVQADLATGRHENPTGHPGWFTTAYFHRPEELAEEPGAAGLTLRELVTVEGIAGWLRNLETRWDDPADRALILEETRAVESEPSLLGLGAHLLAVAQRS